MTGLPSRDRTIPSSGHASTQRAPQASAPTHLAAMNPSSGWLFCPSGLEHHRLAPLWNRLGAALFRYGEDFYNFQGLRSFKDKFDPVWEPRYLASPSGVTLPIVLTNVASLISGGISGVVSK